MKGMILWIKILIIIILALWIIICKLIWIPPNIGMDMNDLYKDPMFNPIMQYEQAYCYYRYLCMQMEYKIKCKEYDKLCDNRSSQDIRRDRKIE